MKKRKLFPKMIAGLLALCMLVGMAPAVSALNPFVQGWYTADPAPVVFSNDPDTLWVYTSHDEDYSHGQSIGGYNMKDYKCFSTQDMVNWTYHGTPVGHQTLSTWSEPDGSAWAQQVVERNGKYYCYAPIFHDTKAWCIAVAVSDSPTGPFVDAINKPLYDAGWAGIDPTVFIDDDGQAYMYWGNPTLYCAKLNEDMVSLGRFTQDEVDPAWATIRSDGTLEMKMTVEAFGWGGDKTGDGAVDAAYQEGPWFFKRNDTYYMVYPSIVEGSGESMSYSTSPGPLGPWTYRGVILDTTKQGEPNFNCYTIHGGTVDFKGHSYLFYHNGGLPDGGTYKRSVAVEEFVWGEDGTIPYIPRTNQGVAPVDTLDPYALQQAETIAWSDGIRPIERNDGTISVQNISNGDSIRVMNVDFGSKGAVMFTAKAAASTAGGSVDVHVDSKNGTKIATLQIPNTAGAWRELSTGMSSAVSGVHDVYFVFHGGSGDSLYELDTWQFTEKSDAMTADTVVGLNVSADTYEIDTVAGRNQATVTVSAIYADGHVADVSKDAGLKITGDAHAEAKGNVVTGKAYGEAKLTVSFGGKEVPLQLTVKDMAAILSVTSLRVDASSVDLYVSGSKGITVTAVYGDGHTEDVTAKATYTSSNAAVATCEAGKITAKAEGTATVTAAFKGQLGNEQKATVTVKVGYRDPFKRVEAETYDERVQRSGNVLIETDTTDTEDQNGRSLGYIQDNDWIKLSGLKFEKDAVELFARVASESRSFNIEFRKNSRDGELIGRITGSTTGGWNSWDLRETTVDVKAGEVFDLYVVFANGDMDINWLQFGDGTGPVYPEIDPYQKVEAETFVQKNGADLVVEDKGSYKNVGYISDGDWIKYPNVNFANGAVKVTVRAGFAYYGDTRTIRLRLDSSGTEPAAVMTLYAEGGTGGFESYRDFTFEVDPGKLNGVHDLYMCFDNGNVNIDWWQFERAEVPEEPIPASMIVGNYGAAPLKVKVTSVEELEAYLEEYHYGKAPTGFEQSKYDAAFFEDHILYLTLVAATGSSPKLAVESVEETESAIEVLVTRPNHTEVTPDMVAWILLLELDKAQAEKKVVVTAPELGDGDVRAVMIKIENIGVVTLESEAAIKDARAAYDSLTEAQKAQVKNAEDLTAAEAKLEELKNHIPFTDVSGWYEDAVRYVYRNKLMNGTSDTTFNPDGIVSRAQLVTILYRMAGEPKVSGESVFTDVPAGQWYSDAIAWAAAEGIVNGVGNGRFDPNGPVTREQIVTILHRYCGTPPEATANLDRFPDKQEVSSFAWDALCWATFNEVITGVTSGDDILLAPKATATRAQIATIIMRFQETFYDTV